MASCEELLGTICLLEILMVCLYSFSVRISICVLNKLLDNAVVDLDGSVFSMIIEIRKVNK